MAKKTKRRLPIINYEIRSIEDYDMLTDNMMVKKKVYDHLIEAVQYGIHMNKSKVDLFKIQDSENILTLEKDKWKTTLEKAISFYTENEDYEKCMDCKELVSRL